MDRQKKLSFVLLITIATNLLLSLIKILSGFFGSSQAMISDGIHSASDVFTSLLVLLGVKIGSPNPDGKHPYGHEKFESIIALLLSLVLFVVSFLLTYEAIITIIDFQKNQTIPDMSEIYVLIVAFFSIFIKEVLFRYSYYTGKKYKSPAMMADAWHNRTDSLSSLATLLGIIGVLIGKQINVAWMALLDPIASIIISLFLIHATIHILRKAINQLVDSSADEQTKEKIQNVISSFESVKAIDILRTRVHGLQVYVDAELQVDGNLSLDSAHEIAELIHQKLEAEIPEIKHCHIHLNPYSEFKSEV